VVVKVDTQNFRQEGGNRQSGVGFPLIVVLKIKSGRLNRICGAYRGGGGGPSRKEENRSIFSSKRNGGPAAEEKGKKGKEAFQVLYYIKKGGREP